MSCDKDEPSLSFGSTIEITVEDLPEYESDNTTFKKGQTFTVFVSMVDINIHRCIRSSKDGNFDNTYRTISYSLKDFSLKDFSIKSQNKKTSQIISQIYLSERFGKFNLIWNPYPSELDNTKWPCSVKICPVTLQE